MQQSRAGQRHTGHVTGESAGDVGSIARGARVLQTLADVGGPLGVSELSRRCGFSKSSMQRVLQALQQSGMLERDGTRYRLGLTLFEWGQQVPRQRDLRDAARPFMADLAQATGHQVHLAVLDVSDVVYLEVVRGAGSPALPTRMGSRWPAHGTGIGKAILAYSHSDDLEDVLASGLPKLSERTIAAPGSFLAELGRIRERGVAFDLEESRAGIACAACPVFGNTGEVLAGISVSGWHSRINLEQTAAAVRTAALSLSRTLTVTTP